LDKAIHIYAWFLLVVTALPALARLLRPRELAHIVLMRFQNPKRRKQVRVGGLIYLGLSAMALIFLLVAPVHQQRWLIMAVLVGTVSALEFVLSSRLTEEEPLTRLNRTFGGAYAVLAIASILLLFTR
jgi:hypothetical protein